MCRFSNPCPIRANVRKIKMEFVLKKNHDCEGTGLRVLRDYRKTVRVFTCTSVPELRR